MKVHKFANSLTEENREALAVKGWVKVIAHPDSRPEEILEAANGLLECARRRVGE